MCTSYLGYLFQKEHSYWLYQCFFLANDEPDTWLEDFLHTSILPDFGTDIRRSQHRPLVAHVQRSFPFL